MLPALVFGVEVRAPAEEQADPTPRLAIERLQRQPVSRFEWGMERLHRAVATHFSLDTTTAMPFSPPFFVNVNFDTDEARITIEVGRTFGTLNPADARRECRDYVTRVRARLGVDVNGAPVTGGHSSLAAEFFHPVIDSGMPDPGLAAAIDDALVIRVLVAAPLNGVFSVCSARLTGSDIRYVK